MLHAVVWFFSGASCTYMYITTATRYCATVPCALCFQGVLGVEGHQCLTVWGTSYGVHGCRRGCSEPVSPGRSLLDAIKAGRHHSFPPETLPFSLRLGLGFCFLISHSHTSTGRSLGGRSSPRPPPAGGTRAFKLWAAPRSLQYLYYQSSRSFLARILLCLCLLRQATTRHPLTP